MTATTTAEAALQRRLDTAESWFCRERGRLLAAPTWRVVARLLSPAARSLVVLAAGLTGGVLQALSPSADAEAFLQAAHQLLGPEWADVFADPFLQIGPLHLVVVAASVLLARGTGLPELFAAGALQAVLVAVLAHVAADALLPGRSPGQRLKRAVLVGSVLLAGPLASAALHGHDEELFVTLLLVAASSGRRSRCAPLLVGLAGGVKLWGLLGMPLLFVGVSVRRGALRSLFAAGLVAAAYAPFVAVGRVGTFGFVWRVASGAPLSALLEVGAPFDWPFRLAQGAASVGLGLWLARRGVDGQRVLVAICTVRLLLDPNPFSYYGIALLLSVQSWSMLAVRVPLLASTVATLAVPLGVLGPDLVRDRPALYVLAELGALSATAWMLLQSPRPALVHRDGSTLGHRVGTVLDS